MVKSLPPATRAQRFADMLDVATKQLTTYCASGPPGTCGKGEIEAALDTTIVTLASHVIVEEWAIMYGAAHGVNGGGASIVIRHCDIAWIGGGVRYGIVRRRRRLKKIMVAEGDHAVTDGHVFRELVNITFMK